MSFRGYILSRCVGAVLVLFFGLSIAHASPPSVSFGDFLTAYFSSIGEDIPDSYQYIDVNITDVTPGTPLHIALQKAIYMNLIKNIDAPINHQHLVTQGMIARIIKDHFTIDVAHEPKEGASIEFIKDVLSDLPSYKQQWCQAKIILPTINIPDYAIVKQRQFRILNDVYTRLTTQHINASGMDTSQLLYSAIKGMVDSVDDEYASFMVPQEFSDYYEINQAGKYQGIGAHIEKVDEGIKIVSPLDGSPALKAGLKAGDVITHIDGKSTVSMDEREASNLIKGPEGTSVQLSIKRQQKTFDVIVIRAEIVMAVVEHSKIDKQTYYIKLNAFNDGSATIFDKAIEAMKQAKTSKLILDLRNNPGGSINELVQMISHFVASKQAVLVMENNQGEHVVSVSGGKDLIKNQKIIVLVNHGSASASEIMALGLREYQNAVLVGETTFGKGSAQDVILYTDGSGFKYTSYHRLSGKNKVSIGGKGIVPDHSIVLDENGGQDNQLEFAKGL